MLWNLAMEVRGLLHSGGSPPSRFWNSRRLGGRLRPCNPDGAIQCNGTTLQPARAPHRVPFVRPGTLPITSPILSFCPFPLSTRRSIDPRPYPQRPADLWPFGTGRSWLQEQTPSSVASWWHVRETRCTTCCCLTVAAHVLPAWGSCVATAVLPPAASRPWG